MPKKRKPPTEKFSEDEQALRDVLNRPPNWSRVNPKWSMNNDWPMVPEHAPPFRPDTPVNNPTVAQQLRMLEQIAPEIRGRLEGGITLGPTRGSMNVMSRSNLPIDAFDNTTLQGVFNSGERTIGLRPRLERNPSELFNTLAHEVTHGAGYDDDKAYPVGKLAEKLFKSWHSYPDSPFESSDGVKRKKKDGQ